MIRPTPHELCELAEKGHQTTKLAFRAGIWKALRIAAHSGVYSTSMWLGEDDELVQELRDAGFEVKRNTSSPYHVIAWGGAEG